MPNCFDCGIPLTGGLDTFGCYNEPLCYTCWQDRQDLRMLDECDPPNPYYIVDPETGQRIIDLLPTPGYVWEDPFPAEMEQ